MKIYRIPNEAPQAPELSFDDGWEGREREHTAALAAWLQTQGYTGAHSGKIVQFPVADGCAQYMLADGRGRYGPSFLLHLPYGDAWHYGDAAYLPKKVIIERIRQQEGLARLFSRAA